MNSSLKIGAVSGLVAGFVSGIVATVFVKMSLSMGLPFYWDPAPVPPITNIAINEIVLSVLYGIMLGITYSKVYSLIPGKGVLKALCYSLAMFVLYSVLLSTFALAYGYIEGTISTLFSDIFLFIAYGLVLGFFYESLHIRYGLTEKEPKIATYSMRGGIYPGAVAGILNGATAFLTIFLTTVYDLYQKTYTVTIPGYLTNIDFLISQLQTHILLNMVWGIVIGVIYTQVYHVVPGKGVLKGLVFGIVYFLIHSGKAAFGFALYGQMFTEMFVSLAYVGFLGDGIVNGLALGALYKK